ncbi:MULTISPECIES: LruC domain-containing protein [unclassified Vibrio]|uniref:LruC domain-containing protein n=1 Tax=unclassified Vibrio TaxID=2614977 RepID=UPI0035502631
MRNWNSVILPSCLMPCFAMALTTADLSFESGADASNYSVKGKPNNTYSIADSLPQDVLTNVYSMLPEGSTVNSAFIAPERYSSIDIDDELNGAEYATAKITFLNEGAGYRNSLGYFVFDTNNPPATKDDINAHVIVFPNTSVASVGEMQEGDTIDLSVQLTAGQTLAFFIISNGWGWEGSYNNIPWLGGWGTPFYSYPPINPEATAVNRRHNVAFLDTENEFLVLGFEDIYRPSGDNDFNDLIFTVEVSPFTAIDGVNEDGTTDSKYEVLVQENKDVVWRYRVTEQLNGQRELKNLTIDYTLQAMGAGYSNGYALKLPNVLPANVASTTLTRNGVAVGHTILKEGSSETILMVSEDLRVELENLGELTENCVFYRTQSACSEQQNADALNYQLYVEFTSPVSRDEIGYPPYDSFIFAAEDMYHGDFVGTPPGMTWQTHLKAFSGTSDMNNALFNSHDDRSSGSESFKTSNNMPWVINIRDEWDHPVEYIDISEAYTSFPTWVTSSGETDGEWYKASITNKIISATDE